MLSHRLKQGFTLVETTVTAGIISTALLAVLGLFSASMTTSRETREMTGANLLARRLNLEVMQADLMKNRNEVVAVFDESLRLVASSLENQNVNGWYQAGASIKEASYVVKVTREVPPASVIAASEIVISVESPAVAPAGNRKAHRYVTRSAD
jgi:Tfp pilus assembly protein PilV